MPDRTVPEQLTKYLTDIHSIEVQALAQMKAAPDIAGDLTTQLPGDHPAWVMSVHPRWA